MYPIEYLSVGGIEFSESKHTQTVYSNDEVYPFSLVRFSVENRRETLHLGLNRQFSFYKGRIILDAGVHLVKRMYKYRWDAFTSGSFIPTDYAQDYDSIKYGYSLFVTNDSKMAGKNYIVGDKHFFNTEVSLDMKIRTYKNLYTSVGVSYSRNNIFYYDYANCVDFYSGGSPIPVKTNYDGFNDGFGVKDHHLYVNVGVSYLFNKKKNDKK